MLLEAPAILPFLSLPLQIVCDFIAVVEQSASVMYFILLKVEITHTMETVFTCLAFKF